MTVNENTSAEHIDAEPEVTFFAPVRPTVVQALRPGDEILVPTDDGPFPHVAQRARITDIRDDEASRLITVNGDLIGEVSGLFEKPANPGEVLHRLVQPGEPPQNESSILVRGDKLWKWIGATMNVADQPEQFILLAWQRVQDDEIDGEAIEVRMRSVWNPRKTVTQTAMLDSTIAFKGYR
ncbi:hypothetical protein [Mycolicibacterium stellerae]|uniref:hypothetical protein n=1 Tax=Mycolicibacterium stellerae TaxID=2358193 RepID=UPI000F0BAE19|nr:hypothetical protein [Mycolicibacterium stellerae]